jgi:hypothetical protein
MGEECHVVLNLLGQKMESMVFQDMMKENMAKMENTEKMVKMAAMAATVVQVFMGMEAMEETEEMPTNYIFWKIIPH